MQAKVVSCGSGQIRLLLLLAYMSCSRMYNDYDGIQQHDYTRKQGLIYQEACLS